MEIHYTTLLNGNYTDINTKIIVNKPNLSGFNKEVTYYVTWQEAEDSYIENSSIDLNQSQPAEWYDYSNKQWANIKTTGNDKTAYWVWIPRFAYMIENNYHTENVGNIQVKFLKGTSNIPYGENQEITNTTQGNGKWLVHPAFEKGDTHLEGIWVAKYEASGSSDNINVVPNTNSIYNIEINNAFLQCRYLETSNETLGLTMSKENISSSGKDTTSGIDTILMRNSDWGAVALLSKSKYGKQDKLFINSYRSELLETKTGASSNTIDAEVTTEGHEYNTKGGVVSSSTGNVYGIYDLRGGKNEFVSAYLKNDTSDKLKQIDERFVDIYNVGQTDTQTGNYAQLLVDNKYGDCLYETSSGIDGNFSWEQNTSNFILENNSYLIRGGSYNDGINAGIFSFNYSDGEQNENVTFRPVILQK